IRDLTVTGVQTCALPIYALFHTGEFFRLGARETAVASEEFPGVKQGVAQAIPGLGAVRRDPCVPLPVVHQNGLGCLRGIGGAERSEERRVGKEWRSGCGP